MSINMSWGYNNAFNIFRRRATVEFRTPNVTDAQLKTIRKFIRNAWSTERKKSLMEEDKQLLDIVQCLGGVPKGKRQGEYKTFCEQVRQEFNALAVAYEYKSTASGKPRGINISGCVKRYNALYIRQHHTKAELDI